ncbi:hypothetical protein A3F64_01665 [Candidatus Saccharibacteria bacterium RIFCSPHIGHO2_12_FULL_42_8]|nr:MAG: hypothetical protein A3F64_01665 [Candidatus Saccharibacteria bacterium RIFCSPHIGHO2_12_FULL_42_8]
MVMILIIHILIALSSVAYVSYMFFAPSRSKFVVSYSLVGMTLVSGSFLVLLQPAHMAQACVSGLAYTAFVLVAIVAAKRRLVKIPIER